jgi:hypothetical protein
MPISNLERRIESTTQGIRPPREDCVEQKIRSSCIVSSISQSIYISHFPPTTCLPINPPRSSHKVHTRKSTPPPLHRLALFHIGMSIGAGAASCLPATTHPFSPTSRLQHDQRNPHAKAEYSISVHASPCKSGSKFSQTACEGRTSRSPGGGVSLGL